MNFNVGGIDRGLRIIVGIAIILWGVMSGSLWGVIGVVPVLTGLVKWCPLYLPFGIKTVKAKEK
ncbi:MAG: DUF2892 domain-containing protein [Gammaproteobacteria bacterium]|nr:DUF2892 domain-containing protein [Gammaproteobacteria bacterium]